MREVHFYAGLSVSLQRLYVGGPVGLGVCFFVRTFLVPLLLRTQVHVRLGVPETGYPHWEVKVFHNVSQVGHGLAGPDGTGSLYIYGYLTHHGGANWRIRPSPLGVSSWRRRRSGKCKTSVNPMTLKFTFKLVVWLMKNSAQPG